MPAHDLEIEIMRRGRHEDDVDLRADPANIPGLQAILRGWLEGNGWDPRMWAQFSAAVRLAGESKVRKTVRVVP